MNPDQRTDVHEYRLLKLCSRTELDEEHQAQIAALLDSGAIRWEHLIPLAAYHGVQPLLYCHLRALPEVTLPEQHITKLRTTVGVRTAHSLVLTQEIGRLGSLFDQHGLRVLVLKGVALAQRVYGSLALRPFVDIDLVVSPEQFSSLEQLLSEEGYDEQHMSRIQKQSYLAIHGQYTFWRRGSVSGTGASVIDVHTAIMPPGYAYAARFDELWERSQSFEVGGGEVRTTEAEDLLLILCYHGFKNRWERLKFICDLAELVRKRPGLDWETVRARAETMNSRRVLHLGLYLAAEELGAELPDDIRREVNADRRACEIGEAVIKRLPGQIYMKSEPFWERVQFNMHGQDSLGGRLRYATYSAVRRLSEIYLPEGD